MRLEPSIPAELRGISYANFQLIQNTIAAAGSTLSLPELRRIFREFSKEISDIKFRKHTGGPRVEVWISIVVSI